MRFKIPLGFLFDKLKMHNEKDDIKSDVDLLRFQRDIIVYYWDSKKNFRKLGEYNVDSRMFEPIIWKQWFKLNYVRLWKEFSKLIIK